MRGGGGRNIRRNWDENEGISTDRGQQAKWGMVRQLTEFAFSVH